MGKHSDYKKIEGYPNYYTNSSGLITFRKRINGAQVTIPTGVKGMRDAKKFVDNELIQRFSANPAAEKRKKAGISNPLIRDLWAEMVTEKAPKKAEHTLENYSTSWKMAIEPFWGDLSINQISQSQVTKFENWYLKNRGTKTYFNVHKHLGMFFRWLKKQKMIAEVPELEQLDTTIAVNTKRADVGRVYTQEEIEALVKRAVNERTRIAILIYRSLGCRKMELLSSKTENWHLETKEVELWSDKNKCWRKIPIPDSIFSEVKAWAQERRKKGDVYMFPAERDPSTHIASQVFDKDWKMTKIRAGIRGATIKNAARIHDLRHTFATQTANDNWPVIHACFVLDMTPKEYHRTYTHIKSVDVHSWMKRSFSLDLEGK